MKWRTGAVLGIGVMVGMCVAQGMRTGAWATGPAGGAPGMTSSAPATAPATMKPVPPVDVSTAILQREGATLRVLNATIQVPESKEVRHVDVALEFDVSKEGKVSVTSVETTPTSLVGVNALVAGTYSDGKAAYEIKGPALDVNMRPTWTIGGKAFYGSVAAGPVAGHPMIGALKGTQSLPESGAYGLAYHDLAFVGFINSPNVLVNLKQVGDTIVVTGYAPAGATYQQTGVVVLQRK